LRTTGWMGASSLILLSWNVMKFHMSQACSRQTAASAAILRSQKCQNVSSSVFHLALAAAPVLHSIYLFRGISYFYMCNRPWHESQISLILRQETQEYVYMTFWGSYLSLKFPTTAVTYRLCSNHRV
jgi:hypothetical protein